MTEIYHEPTVWRDRLFDSVLECDWAASLTVYGVDWLHHPGSLRLSDGREYQPDFVLRNAGEYGTDILLEVKGDGVPGLDKAALVQQDNPNLIVLVGRPPYLRGDDHSEYSAAVWHRVDGSSFDWDINGKGEVYVSGELATAERPGLKFYKGLTNTRLIR